MEKTINFLIASINDTQGIIRAIDTKLHIVLALYLIPFTMLDKIFNVIKKVANSPDMDCLLFFCIIFFLLWLLGLFFSILGIIAISNPYKVVSNQQDTNDANCSICPAPKSTFYVTYPISKGKYTKTLSWHISRLPKDENEIIIELASVQMILSYIRNVKIMRHQFASWIAIGWGACVVIIVLLYCHNTVW